MSRQHLPVLTMENRWSAMSEKMTLTEKRFFEWHPDDVSVTLRNRGGSYGGGQRYSLSALSGNSRKPLRHRLQVGAARTSDARKADSL